MEEQARRALDDIEQNLVREDPAFVAQMDPNRPQLPRFPTVSVLCASLYILMPLVMLLFGWLAVVFTIAAFAVAVGSVLLRHRFHS